MLATESPCPIPNCTNHAPSDSLMCKQHWSEVPEVNRRQIRLRGQQVARAVNGKNAIMLVSAMRLYREACQTAVAEVSKMEVA